MVLFFPVTFLTPVGTTNQQSFSSGIRVVTVARDSEASHSGNVAFLKHFPQTFSVFLFYLF
jgi:hypothetical protein